MRLVIDNKRNLYLESCYLTGLSHIVHRLCMSLSWMWMVVVVQEWRLCVAWLRREVGTYHRRLEVFLNEGSVVMKTHTRMATIAAYNWRFTFGRQALFESTSSWRCVCSTRPNSEHCRLYIQLYSIADIRTKNVCSNSCSSSARYEMRPWGIIVRISVSRPPPPTLLETVL